ncbi:MAG TPA: hypothetical protein VGP25_06790 [Gemmatimonadaceae bacterium]|jgi:hypothetical protein|nr:hypothetical protein [Gemmatimonadaceae bacterium]
MSSLARRSAAAVALVLASASLAGAQTATQTVTFQVNPINVIAFTGSPSLTISTATPGSATASVTDATSNWAVTTNQTGAKITASIPSAMPAGLTLSANLTAPTGGTSAGLKALGVVAVDVVTGVTKVAQGSLGVTYQLDATATAGVVASSSKVVTYTITGGT